MAVYCLVLVMTIKTTLNERLQERFTPTLLDVVNESAMHNVPPGSESHFKVTLVSDQFAGMRQVARHQAVYGAVSDLMTQGIHALALHTYTPDEWLERGAAPASPNCLGGSKRE